MVKPPCRRVEMPSSTMPPQSICADPAIAAHAAEPTSVLWSGRRCRQKQNRNHTEQKKYMDSTRERAHAYVAARILKGLSDTSSCARNGLASTLQRSRAAAKKGKHAGAEGVVRIIQESSSWEEAAAVAAICDGTSSAAFVGAITNLGGSICSVRHGSQAMLRNASSACCERQQQGSSRFTSGRHPQTPEKKPIALFEQRWLRLLCGQHNKLTNNIAIMAHLTRTLSTREGPTTIIVVIVLS